MARITCFSILINRNSSTRGNARNLQWCTNGPTLILTPSQQSILKALSWVQSRIFHNFLHFVTYFAPKSTFYTYTRLDTQEIFSKQRLLHVFWAETTCSSAEVHRCFRATYCLHLQGLSAVSRWFVSWFTRRHWRWNQIILPKLRWTRLRSITAQKIAFCIVAAMKTLNPTCLYVLFMLQINYPILWTIINTNNK